MGKGIGGIGQIGGGFRIGEGAGHITLAHVDSARHHATIAGGTAEARLVGIEHDAVEPFAIEFQRRVEAGITGPDDRNAHLFRQADLG